MATDRVPPMRWPSRPRFGNGGPQAIAGTALVLVWFFWIFALLFLWVWAVETVWRLGSGAALRALAR